jgi:polysaccharide pyruvyl transferase WcaK-like protein
MSSRKTFLEGSLQLAFLAGISQNLLHGDLTSKKTILLRSSWQTVNIGDIAHTPGVLALLERYCPNVKVKLWPSDTRNGVKEMLQQRFPNLEIIHRKNLKAEMQSADFLLHGSGPSLVAFKDVKRWVDTTGKPFGVFGITLPAIYDGLVDILNRADFIFFRDSHSLAFAKTQGVKAPLMKFGPDGAFGVDLRNESKARSFMSQHKLEDQNFLCCIPRYRYTPYWKIKNKPFNHERHERNEEMKEHDHAPLRKAIEAVIQQSDMKVLICPEDQSQMEIGKEMLYDKLPSQMKHRIIWRENYWLTDEALSIYSHSAGLFGLEMHSPIMCIGNDIPAIVCRFKEQTSKGYMWEDIGLTDWLFDMDQPKQVQKLTETVLQLALQPHTSKQKAIAARKRVEAFQRNMTDQLLHALS